MNDNEHLPDLLSDDDLARLVSLVRSAYPAPPDGFGEAVMKKIRDENRALTQQASVYLDSCSFCSI